MTDVQAFCYGDQMRVDPADATPVVTDQTEASDNQVALSRTGKRSSTHQGYTSLRRVDHLYPDRARLAV